MLISAETLLRTVLLTVCVGYWLAALPALSGAFVVASFAGDLVATGLVALAVLSHTMGLVLLGGVFEQTLRPPKPRVRASWMS